jgi:hemin uptake protein HemP
MSERPPERPDDEPEPEESEMQTTVEVESSLRAVLRTRTVSARDLLGPDRILRIEHEGQLYTLRITRNERLILTK